MSWIDKLCQTYDAFEENEFAGAEDFPPVTCKLAKADIQITISIDGEFIEAKRLEKDKLSIRIPCTMKSSGARTSGSAPHPLFDELQYIAGDFQNYYSSNNKHDGDKFTDYSKQLKEWVTSEFTNEYVTAIWKYIEKEHVIEELLNDNVLTLNELTDEKQREKTRKLFVCFSIDIVGEQIVDVWSQKSVQQNWKQYYISKPNEFEQQKFCYVSGKLEPAITTHPGIKGTAKLICSNDNNLFTYKGRISNADDAACVSYIAAQKYGNTLNWLITQQGVYVDSRIFVIWETRNKEIPDVCSGNGLDSTEPETINTAKAYAKHLKLAIHGYAKNLGDTSDVVVLGLNAATKGRRSIIYYRELKSSDYLRRIESWYTSLCWEMPYNPNLKDDKDKNKKKKTWIWSCKTPTPNEITEAALGKNCSPKVKSLTVERLLHSIIDGAPIPFTLVQAAFRNSCRISYKEYEKNETEKVRGVSCAIIRKYYNDNTKTDTERWKMNLDELETDRNYLFGRLLAFARGIEDYAHGINKISRETNADRFMIQYSQKPMSTWEVLRKMKLKPYLNIARQYSWGRLLEEKMDNVMELFLTVPNGYSDEKLSPIFLLGYQSQLTQLRNEKKKYDELRKINKNRDNNEEVKNDNA